MGEMIDRSACHAIRVPKTNTCGPCRCHPPRQWKSRAGNSGFGDGDGGGDGDGDGDSSRRMTRSPADIHGYIAPAQNLPSTPDAAPS
jgi:hypothetical protein